MISKKGQINQKYNTMLNLMTSGCGKPKECADLIFLNYDSPTYRVQEFTRGFYILLRLRVI